MKLNEVYRSRPYSYILVLHVVENVLGVAVLLLVMTIFGMPNYGRDVIVLFCVLSTLLAFSVKGFVLSCLAHHQAQRPKHA